MTTQPPTGRSPGARIPPPNLRTRRLALVAVLLIVIAGLTAGAGLVMVNRASPEVTGDDARYLLTETVAADPIFESRDARGQDPFFAIELQLTSYQAEVEEELRDQARELLDSTDDPNAQVEIPEFDVAALEAEAKTGLYGGTAENTCDPERLISFLYAHPNLAEAWAIVQGITVAEIADYIRSLDVRVLAEDTAVLNHGYDVETGAPYEIDAILEAGTAVLVDENGDIRTRCYCGNPIKPKPPEHMPPRCVIWIEHVFVAPGSEEKREGAVRDVLLTGQEANVDGSGLWYEVKWGDAENERGWVRADNLAHHYCPPEQVDFWCPGPGQVPVWELADTNNQVGWHMGTVNTIDGPVDIFGPIEVVGGVDPVIIDGFVLVRFTPEADSVDNSAWVRLDDLQQDEDLCEKIPVCVRTDGDVYDRAGGAMKAAGGTMQVVFTGRFVSDVVTHAEVRLVEIDGSHGWIANSYTPLADEDCDDVPTYECVGDNGNEAGTIVFETADQVLPQHLGHLYNATVEVLPGGPENGRVPIRMAPGGPDGWIDESNFVEDRGQCVPRFDCYATIGEAYEVYETDGAVLDPQGPSLIGVVGKIVDGAPAYTRIEVPGADPLRYWIPVNDLVLLPDHDCGPIDCPTYGIVVPGTAGEAIDASKCCVAALYDTTDTSLPVGNPSDYPRVVMVVGTVVVDNGDGPETWFVTSEGDYFREQNIVFGHDCMVECPQVVTPGTAVDAARPATVLVGADDECCVQGSLYAEPDGASAVVGVLDEPTVVTVLEVDGDFYRIATLEGDVWVHVSQFLDLGECEMVPDPCSMDMDGMVDIADPPPAPGYDPGDSADQGEGEPQAEDRPVDRETELDECCIQGRVRTAPPVIADGSDWLTIEPTLGTPTGNVDTESDGGPWVEYATDEHGLVWANAENVLVIEYCRNVQCPAESQVAVAIVDDFEEGLSYFVYTCCVSMTDAAGAVTYKPVTLTGDTMELGGGVVSYLATDGNWYVETDFAHADRCTERPCEDGSVVTLADECPDPGFQCPDGTVVLTPSDCPVPACPEVQQLATGECCPAGSVARDGDCVVPCPGGEFVPVGQDCPEPCPQEQQLATGECCPAGSVARDGSCAVPCPGGRFVPVGQDCPEPCPEEQQLATGECCPAGSVARDGDCYERCPGGRFVLVGEQCPEPCPDERQLPAGECCPPRTVAGSADCFIVCADGSQVLVGQDCTKSCPDGSVVPVSEQCPPIIAVPVLPVCAPAQQIPTGGCCPPNERPVQSPSNPNNYICVRPEG